MKKCTTCEEALIESANFCQNCGAKQVHKRLTLSTLFKNLFSKLANLDFSFYKTSKWLLVNPEKVTIGYINGVRKIIKSPMQYAIIVLSVYGLFQFLFSDFLELISENSYLSNAIQGWNNYENPEESFQGDHKVDETITWLQSRNQFLLFSMIPCIGGVSRILYRKSGYNLAEHYVISIYAVSFTLIMSVLLGLIFTLFPSEASAVFYVNSSFVLSVISILWIFKRSLKGAIFKPLLLLFLSFLSMVILLFFVSLFFLL